MYTRNNLLNSKKFVFPVFEFNDFNIQYSDVYIKWRDIQNIYKFRTNLQSYLKKALKLLWEALHPENNKHIFLYPFQYLTKQLLLN